MIYYHLYLYLGSNKKENVLYYLYNNISWSDKLMKKTLVKYTFNSINHYKKEWSTDNEKEIDECLKDLNDLNDKLIDLGPSEKGIWEENKDVIEIFEGDTKDRLITKLMNCFNRSMSFNGIGKNCFMENIHRELKPFFDNYRKIKEKENE